MTSERRQHFRGSARPGRRIEIRFRRGGSQEDHARAVTRNIGIGGAFIVTSERPPVGSRLDLLIDMPDAREPIAVIAEVRWSAEGAAGTKGGIGVRFLELDVPSMLALSDYFASLSTPSPAEGEGADSE